LVFGLNRLAKIIFVPIECIWIISNRAGSVSIKCQPHKPFEWLQLAEFTHTSLQNAYSIPVIGTRKKLHCSIAATENKASDPKAPFGITSTIAKCIILRDNN
jgi:hypothetical protein